jgi:hypothetical protein
MALKIVRVSALPEVVTPNTIYLLRNADDASLFDLYASDSTGQAVRHIATKSESVASVIIYSPTPPALPNPVRFWWNTADASLNVQYENEGTTVWVEAMPSIAVPDFDGTGTANTMARSDHDHDQTYAKIGNNEW